jgi:hypothetical protein
VKRVIIWAFIKGKLYFASNIKEAFAVISNLKGFKGHCIATLKEFKEASAVISNPASKFWPVRHIMELKWN